MTKIETKGLVGHFRRAGPPALLAACLAVGPALAQSTTIVTDPTVESSKTKVKVKEKGNGDTVVKKKTTTTDGDTTVKTRTKTTTDDDAGMTVKVR